MSLASEWVRAVRADLIASRGGGCERCESPDDLEFHHLHRNGLQGNGRGSVKRLRDVLARPDDYQLLCAPCHAAVDPYRYAPHTFAPPAARGK